jgi:drug/metabolite transporter (DMT)-like permease
MQLTFVRGVVCSLMVLLMVNRNVKSTLWDPVDCKTLPSLIFRCVQGAASVYISFSSINYFDVSTVGIVCSLKPILACILGVTILGEHMGYRDVVCMSAVFIAVFLVIFGSSGSQQTSMESNPWAMVSLIAQPFLLAGGDISMRKMKKMPEQLCSAYQNLSLCALASFYMLCTGLRFDFMLDLSLEAWGYLVLSCGLTILTQLAKSNAFKYSESARLQKLSFLPNVW